jgi:L-alanine-DL-glutamate epimerase-like enolase superfamily enzyme
MLRFRHYEFDILREPFLRPFHFKGGSFNEKWINLTTLYPGADDAGRPSEGFSGIGGNAVLWSDAEVFSSHSETGGNLLMSLVAERAVQLLIDRLQRGEEFADPICAIQAILPELRSFACTVSGRVELRPTFTLNAAVSLDLALWKLQAAVQGSDTFAQLIPEPCRRAFPCRNESVARVPLVTYNLPEEELLQLVDEGHFLLKIKIGQAGEQAEMLRRDIARLEWIHGLLRDRRTDRTANGRLAYYLDANGRYPEKNAVRALVEGLEKMGALDQVILLEEPFPDDTQYPVHDLPLRIAADESLHSVEDVQRRIELGYGAFALKPAGKTLSISLLMAAEAVAQGIPCFVADSACVPLLLDWNRNVAAHLSAFPGLSCSFLESNGAQNYRNWQALMSAHPCAGAQWLEPRGGMYHLDEDFYRSAGGVFQPLGL